MITSDELLSIRVPIKSSPRVLYVDATILSAFSLLSPYSVKLSLNKIAGATVHLTVTPSRIMTESESIEICPFHVPLKE